MAQRIFTLILLLCSIRLQQLFDAPGRSQFEPAGTGHLFCFQQNQHDLTLSAVKGLLPLP